MKAKQLLVSFFCCFLFIGCISGSDTEKRAIRDLLMLHIGKLELVVIHFSTPEFSDDTTRLVVASTSEEDGTAYMLQSPA